MHLKMNGMNDALKLRNVRVDYLLEISLRSCYHVMSYIRVFSAALLP